MKLNEQMLCYAIQSLITVAALALLEDKAELL